MGNDIVIKNLTKNCYGLEKLHNFNLNIKSGEHLFVVGDVGCGSDYILKILAGIEDYEGSVRLGKEERRNLKNGDLLISFLPSVPVLLDNKNALENLKYVCKVYSKNYSDEELLSLLSEFEINPRIKAKKLSSLEKIFLSFARVQIKNSEILLLEVPKFIEEIPQDSPAFLMMVSWLNKFSGTAIVVENGLNIASKCDCEIEILNFGVQKGILNLKNELKNPTCFFSFYETKKITEQVEPIVQKFILKKEVAGFSTSGCADIEFTNELLKNLADSLANFEIGNEVEICEIDGHYFEALTGRVLYTK